MWPDNEWSAKWAAWDIVGQFAATTTWRNITLTLWNTSAAAIKLEIQDLLRAAQDERPDALAEIIAQNNW